MDSQSKLIENLCKKYNLSKYQIEHIILSEFRFVKDVMQAGEYKGVQLPNFGKFVVKPGRLNTYQFKVNKLKKANKFRTRVKGKKVNLSELNNTNITDTTSTKTND